MSTAQKRHARVHTAPISMMVAVPAFQHSPMLGHFASSHTVLKRCSRTIFFTALNSAPVANGARSHGGLRGVARAAHASCFTPSLIAVKPWGVVYFSPLRTGRRRDDGDAFELGHARNCTPLEMPLFSSGSAPPALRCADVLPAPGIQLPRAWPAAMERSHSGFKGNAPSTQPAKNAGR